MNSVEVYPIILDCLITSDDSKKISLIKSNLQGFLESRCKLKRDFYITKVINNITPITTVSNHTVNDDHDDVMTWKRFPHYRSPVDSPHKRTNNADIFVGLNNRIKSRSVGDSKRSCGVTMCWQKLTSILAINKARHHRFNWFKGTTF